jgi:hypothetical protein
LHAIIILSPSPISGIVIQGEAEAELPEQVLACAALKYTDIERHSPLEAFNF